MSTSPSPAELTPKHVRAARALLAWSQQDLAKAAKVATSTVADFERGSRTPVANKAQAIRNALEGAGIRFLPTGVEIGPAVPEIPSSVRNGTPVRWVTVDDLSEWARRKEGPVNLSTLIAFLIRASLGSAVHLRFPADTSVYRSGWDGQTAVGTHDSPYVPKGETAWEFTAQRRDLKGKITRDYDKRTRKPEPFDPASSVWIFVTLQRWPEKDAWAKAMTIAGPWREVRVYDADDLVHWIELSPAVGLWLAKSLGKRPDGTRELDEMWEEWSLATRWPLTEDLVLSGRDQDSTEVLRWLRAAPSVLSLQATSSEEVVAFFHATLSELPDDQAKAYRARCLVVTTADAARALADTQAPLFLILTAPNPGLAQRLAEKGHFVLQAYDESYMSRGEVRMLGRPPREEIANALQAAGIAEPRARALARDSARNLTVLRRLIPGAPGLPPKWADNTPPPALLAALLAGGWDDNVEADKARLSELANAPYDQVIEALTPFVGHFDSPLKKVGSTWRVASLYDAWFQLARHLTVVHITRFEAAADAVLGSADPRFDMDPNERWMVAIKGTNPGYSGMIRHGIGRVLILLAMWGDQVRTVPDAGRRAHAIVARLLDGADQRQWWSLSRDFRLLAEAAPDAFLSAVEDSLDQDEPPISVLFRQDEDGLVGTGYLSDLMWAMEALAWSPAWLPRVTVALARLDAIDIKPRQYSNGPANSLRDIYLLWLPQTYATLDKRLRALDLIRKQQSSAAWKLMLGILPRGSDSSSPSATTLWRDFSVDEEETVTWQLISRGAAAVSERLLEDAGLDVERWAELLDRINDLAPDPATILAVLEVAESRMSAKADRARMWDKLRRVLHHNRKFPDAGWRLADPVLEQLDIVYDRFAPENLLEQVAWLFQNGVTLPHPAAEGWEADQREVEAARVEAARAVHSRGGIAEILALARLTETAGFLGKAIHDAGFPESVIDTLIAATVRSDDPRERNVAHGLIVSVFSARKEAWGVELISQARTLGWGDTALLAIFRALPFGRWTWNQVEGIGGKIETDYWLGAPVLWREDNGEIIYAIRHLIDVGRARHALSLTHRGTGKDIPTELLLEVLTEAARQPFVSDGDSNEATMFQYCVAETLGVLDERDDVDRTALVMLEWKYLNLLEYSHRPPKALLRALSEQPPLFIELLSAAFRPSDESGIAEPEPDDNPEQVRAVASQARRLLSLWDRLPGTREDGSIDGDVLETWIKEALAQAKIVGREDRANDRIGEMLSASPLGADGIWPAEAVRKVLDHFHSERMLEGFRFGKSNRRGVTSRLPRDGGEQERALSAQYRAWATSISFDYPHTSKALEGLAEHYDRDARRHDDAAERIDWQD